MRSAPQPSCNPMISVEIAKKIARSEQNGCANLEVKAAPNKAAN